MPTLRMLLRDAAGRLATSSPTPRLDAELLLAHTLGLSRAGLLAASDGAIPAAAEAAFTALLRRRLDLEPVAYLVGSKEFWGLEFAVDQRVLVPRPETELLVEQALGWAQGRDAALTIADIGTGSGAIAVALALALPQARLFAVDHSPDALAVAATNVRRYGLEERVELLTGDLLGPLTQAVDILVSNPPYTLLAEVDEGVRRHEPALALDGGPDGLALYRRLLAQAPAYLRPGGLLLLELGHDQWPAVASLAATAFPTATISPHHDLAGIVRVLRLSLP